MLLVVALLAGPVRTASARDWTPHTAAALLDANFSSALACQTALKEARETRSEAPPVHGLSYEHLFEQAHCRSFHHDGGIAWRIRMNWTPHTSAPRK
jgi:hypothetical protein